MCDVKFETDYDIDFLFLSLCLSACTKPIQDVSIKTETSSAISEPSIIKPSEENSMQGSDVSKILQMST